MKYIFDFDDTLFDTKRFKAHIFATLQNAGVKVSPETYYNEFREDNKKNQNPFSLRKFIEHVLLKEHISTTTAEYIYEEIMKDCPKFIHESAIEAVKNAGRENCYIITNGDHEFQFAKMARSGIAEIFNPMNVFVTKGTKKDHVYQICDKHKNESVVFFDDKSEFFQDIDKERVVNLETIRIEKGGLVKELRRIGMHSENQEFGKLN